MCVCVRVRVCVGACVRACVRTGVRACTHVRRNERQEATHAERARARARRRQKWETGRTLGPLFSNKVARARARSLSLATSDPAKSQDQSEVHGSRTGSASATGGIPAPCSSLHPGPRTVYSGARRDGRREIGREGGREGERGGGREDERVEQRERGWGRR